MIEIYRIVTRKTLEAGGDGPKLAGQSEVTLRVPFTPRTAKHSVQLPLKVWCATLLTLECAQKIVLDKVGAKKKGGCC